MTSVHPFLEALHDRASVNARTIVFPEADDPRTLEAVRRLAERGTLQPVLVRDVHDDPRVPEVADLLHQRRAERGMTAVQADVHARDPLMFADGLVALGYADGCVAGAVHTTADVIRAALWMIGTAPGVRTVSSAFYMLVPSFRGHDHEVLTFTDCAVVPEPTADQLADIAIAAADDRRRIVGDEPRVAMLSFSTKGSATAPAVTKVREALAIVRAMRPELAVAGEMQADAALIPAIGRRKSPGSSVAGDANVLVFPVARRRQHRVQARGASCGCAGDRSHPSGIGAAGQRPFARRFTGRHCTGGGDHRPAGGERLLSAGRSDRDLTRGSMT